LYGLLWSLYAKKEIYVSIKSCTFTGIEEGIERILDHQTKRSISLIYFALSRRRIPSNVNSQECSTDCTLIPTYPNEISKYDA